MQRILAMLFVLVVPAAAQNLVINGDFERTKATGCEFNLTNAEFDALMPGCTGFGNGQGLGEIDIMQGGSCGYGLPAASGLVKVGIGSGIASSTADAFSFRLKTPLVPGNPYRLNFKANAYVSSFSPQIVAVEVGLSTSATDFGDKVGELVPSAVVWSSFDAVIVPATTARFLTVRFPENSDGWNHVDDFRLETSGPAGLAVGVEDSTIHVAGATPGSLVALLILPASSGFDAGTLVTLLASDGTGSATIEHGNQAGAPLLLQAVDLSTGAVSPVTTLEWCTPQGVPIPLH